MKHIKTPLSFVTGIIVGAVMFGGTAALAAGIMACPSTQTFFMDGKEIALTAYVIEGNNYVKLRDVAAEVDFDVRYDGETNSVQIDPDAPYTPEAQEPEETTAPAQSEHTDHSAEANPTIFSGAYTRDAYNAIRQTILGGDDRAFQTPNETFMQTLGEVTAALGCYPGLYVRTGADGMSTCGVRFPASYDAAAEHTERFIAGLAGKSGNVKAAEIAWYVCDRLTYSAAHTATPGKVLSGDDVQSGSCMSYARSFMFLCQRAGIPCIFVCSDTHQWNMVYVSSGWYEVDLTGDDVGDSTAARSRTTVLHQPGELAGSIHQDRQPEVTAFAMELLVPGGTK